MIGKLKKGSSFGGCIRYVTGKDEAKIIASDGVLLGTNAEMTQSFELQRQLNPRIKKPVGHIALSFKPEDKPRLTDEFMAKIALEYMQMMGITDTQFIIVRHHNTDNPHCHIVYNRVNNEGNLTQWREHQDWEEADLKYRALKMVLSADDPNILYIEKHFSVNRDENVIDYVKNRVAAYEDSVLKYNEMVRMAAYKDSVANELRRESNSIKRTIKKYQ